MKVICKRASPYNLPHLSELKVGDLYRTETIDAIYMKVNDKTYNAVCIESGCVQAHGDNYPVRPVSGAFVEE